MDKSEFWKKVRKVAINKFAITLYVFAVVFVFIGDQSLINQISRAIEMRSIRKKIAKSKPRQPALSTCWNRSTTRIVWSVLHENSIICTPTMRLCISLNNSKL